jgi:hypothetical protein
MEWLADSVLEQRLQPGHLTNGLEKDQTNTTFPDGIYVSSVRQFRCLRAFSRTPAQNDSAPAGDWAAMLTG